MRIMLVPGNGNADVHSEIWYQWMTKQLRSLGLEVVAENMPDADLARREYWLPFIEAKLEGDDNPVIIGHSSGATAAMRFAETHRLLGMALVSACYTDLGYDSEKVSHYFDDPWQWEKIKGNVKWIIQFHSLNDPYIPVEEARFVAERLGSDYKEYPDQGHFSSDVNKTEFPELLEALKKRLGPWTGSMKTILVDAVYTFVIQEEGSFKIFEEMRGLLDAFPNRKIILTMADKEGFKRYGLDKMPYEVFTTGRNPEKADPKYYETVLKHFGLSKDDVVYFEHDEKAVESARSIGIKAYHYDSGKRDLAALKRFLDENL